jgi:ribose/xylose/arabinose/galactoside ABC-type transport system permease subunit
MLVLFLLFMAVVMVAAAIFDRTRAGKRLRAQGGFNLDNSRPAQHGGPGYTPPTEGTGGSSLGNM